MGDYEETQVNPPIIVDKNAHKRGMEELRASYNDINKQSTFSILWHLVCRHKRVWLWLAILGVGYILGFLRVGL